MDLPLNPPVKPMLAKAATTLPTGNGLLYEPKWDGFRCVVFRDGDEVELGSRNERPLTRYFPEVVEAVKQHLPERCVVDGEIVVPAGDRDPHPDELTAHCRERLSPFKVPRRWHVVDDLPMTASGKVQRALLRTAAAQG